MGNIEGKTYRAIRHDIVRKRQSDYCSTAHHPDEKINQIKNSLSENISAWRRAIEIAGDC